MKKKGDNIEFDPKIMIRFAPLKNKTSKTGKNIGTDIADGTILRCKTAARSPLINRGYERSEHPRVVTC